jgi:hypothetical protein
MKIYNIETTNINNGQELADYIYRFVKDTDYESESDFPESEWLKQACIALGWDSIPQSGGLVIEWCD